MPLAPYTAFLVAEAALRHRAGGEALFLGRLWPQALTVAQLRLVLAEHDLAPPPAAELLPADLRIDDHGLCRLLGFVGMEALDFDAREGARLVHDLNLVPPPPEARNRFGTVFNFGTMEHVFHVPNFLANVFHLLGEGGVVVHAAPANGVVEHGFYQLSPTLFYDYYTANGFDVLACHLVKHLTPIGERFELRPFRTFDHAPDPLYGKLGDGVFDVVFFARKTARSRCDVVPTQFRYQRR